MPREFIPISTPMLVGSERTYVLDCLESTWISSAGDYVKRFEARFADFCGQKHAIACCNGTAALHLALLAIGVMPDDEVIVPTLTFVSTAHAVTYCGARPVFVDSEPETWTADPDLIEAKVTPRTKAIVAVHLFGHPVDMDPVLSIARRHGLFVVEDASQAHGAKYKGQRTGSLADIATFSFYANKVITTGDGGMVVTDDARLAKTVAQLCQCGADPARRYWFSVVGYNYRMSNIAAAIGLAQLERIEWHLKRRAEVAAWYAERLRDVSRLTCQREKAWARQAHWMFTVLLDDRIRLSREQIITQLQAGGIETRPVVYPMHVLPPYQHLAQHETYPVADRIAQRGLSLPTWAGLTRQDVSYVCDCLLECLARAPELQHR